ncbi:MAG: hypothetical protein JW709_08435 [Sedimentisphaerales bacterium]|nr:hypothetical protein [Sedimentisphaerales bacterium]
MNKFELIETIRELNNTASIEFLSQFTADELQEYAEHLMSLAAEELTAMAPAIPYH